MREADLDFWASKQEADFTVRKGIKEQEKRLAVLDAALARGIADADAGRVKPLDVVRQRLVAKYEAEANARRK